MCNSRSGFNSSRIDHDTIVYGEIVRTGQIPIIPQVGTKDFNIARLTAASYSIPTVKVSIPEQKDAFLNDDGGY